jgi:predicted DNA-binding transcriptional regulator YafY
VNRSARFGRLLNIVSVVVMRPGLGPTELAAQVGISERTLFRDLARLRRIGLGISYSDGYQLQETLELDGHTRTGPVTLPVVYEQQLRLLRRHLSAELAEKIQADVEARAPAALAALFQESLSRRASAR